MTALKFMPCVVASHMTALSLFRSMVGPCGLCCPLFTQAPRAMQLSLRSAIQAGPFLLLLCAGSGTSSGVNFALPIDTVTRVVPQLIVYGTLNRAFNSMKS